MKKVQQCAPVLTQHISMKKVRQYNNKIVPECVKIPIKMDKTKKKKESFTLEIGGHS